MNTLVIYFSKYGNTHSVAQTIADQFSDTTIKENSSTPVLSLDDLTLKDLQDAHRMNLPESAKAVIGDFPKGLLKGTLVAAFDTSYKMNWFLSQFTAAKKLAHKLRKLGGRRVVPPETFHVMDTEGPLYEGELQRAKTWADTILHKVNNYK